MQCAFAKIAIFMTRVMAIRCFFVNPSRIDEGNSDIYGKDYFCTDDDRGGEK